ncbi:GEVED domain-containing protein [Flavobacterium azooxidireducens]|uniref:GEVED domain-containing protein n=1 Tax=Flavobacterium azooxidireducens TaxID=1871076 RepID=A0ABY4KH30_9FLAO|nr:GEVED domain-containing protein [Flavobacterium azooxidireducens]UPQ79680.1 GEVED domain-containing protein [Flavobacterium azooxidireducens]
MKKKYNILNQSSKVDVLLSLKKYTSITYIVVLFMFLSNDLNAQETYTLGDGVESYNTLGVSPIATINRNNRSQYMYYAEELYNAGFNISGNVVSLAINITELGLPSSLKPENIKIKMGMTTSFEMGPNLVNNLPVYYESSVENITELGWYTFELDTPFAWDGFRNIIVEICRSNTDFGTSFSIQGKNFPMGEIVTAANYTNDASFNGCSLSNQNLLPALFARRRPNMQFTMTNPCETTPSGGQTIVSAGPYCGGEMFTLSVQNGSIESGLSYQWQSSPNDNGPWSDIPGATDAFLETSQSIATYYRRATTCDIASSTVYDFPLLVGGEGCYCTSLVVNENAIGVTSVSLEGTTNSSSSTPAYTNFTGLQIEVERETTVSLSVNVNTMGGTNYTMAWIDWNHDAVFDVSEGYELGSVTGGTNVNSGMVASIEVPADAVLGSTIMRVRTKQSSSSDYPSPCDSIENGEAEDYTLIITENLSIGDFTPLRGNLIIAANSNGIHFKVSEESIQKIEIYDLSGRVVLSKNVADEIEFSVTDFNQTQQLWIVKVGLTNGQQIAKKIIY